jgi:hypothetical protein
LQSSPGGNVPQPVNVAGTPAGSQLHSVKKRRKKFKYKFVSFLTLDNEKFDAQIF